MTLYQLFRGLVRYGGSVYIGLEIVNLGDLG